MEKILKVHSVNDYARYIGAEELHPLISVIHYDELEHCRHSLNNYDVYGIFIADVRLDSLTYGLVNYDLHRHALMCVAPGQIGGKTDEGEEIQTQGWALLFDPALLSGTELAHRMSAYTYFSYNTSEALLMSEEERGIIVGLFERIRTELMEQREQSDACTDSAESRQKSTEGQQKGDAEPRILVAYLTLVLEYIARFYNRQLSTSTKETVDLLSRFETLLTQYYDRQVYQSQGLPSVKYCAQELFLSPNYFGDLIRQMTGDSASNHIRRFLMQRAQMLLTSGHTIGETSDLLGFEYPQHFKIIRRFSLYL
jgi:AraC-like DNA-binding protein